MKKVTLEQMKRYIGQKVKARGRRVYAIYEAEGELLQVHTEPTKEDLFPPDKRIWIVLKLHEPYDEKGDGWTIHHSGLLYIFQSHLISVKTPDGKVFK